MPVPFINSSNATELANRRWNAYRAAQLEPKPELSIVKQDTTSNASTEIDVMLACTREQLKSLDEQLKDCDDPKDWDALTRAKERQFRIWAHLAQLPGPGNLKPSSKAPTSRRPSFVEPTLSPAQPEPEPPNHQ